MPDYIANKPPLRLTHPGHAGHPSNPLIRLDSMRGAMSQLSRMHAGQPRKIAPYLSKQVQWLARMPRMPRIVHKVFGFNNQVRRTPPLHPIAGSRPQERLSRQVRLVVAP